jgi:hypothetical protein
VIDTLVLTGTEYVVTEKVPVVAPAAIVMLTGTVAPDVLLLERLMTAPPDGAAPERVTVPVEALPPETLLGLTAIELIVTTGGA